MPLPILQSLPHGGLDIPPEVSDHIAITPTTIYNECDLWVEQLFDFSSSDGGPLGSVSLEIARVLVDANRPPDDLDNPDGAIKAQTSYGQEIYTSPLSKTLKTQLLDRYWHPYHQKLEDLLLDFQDEVKLLLDCHNMAQRGPSAYGDPGLSRPLICLANLGDEQGEQTNESLSCPAWLIRQAAAIAEELFADMQLLEPGDNEHVPIVGINTPFIGGYILRRHHSASNLPKIPALMVEINRGLYVGDQNADTPISPPNETRTRDVRERLNHWIRLVVDLLGARDSS